MQSTYPIVKLGNPTLRLPSQPIKEDEFGSAYLKNLIEVLFDAMKKEGGIGIAAPQIGINKRIFVFGREDHFIPPTVLVNPVIENLTFTQEEGYEGCLSVGALRGKVPRYTRVYYKGYDEEGNLIENEVGDLHARVVQHENDHLDGIIFIDKIKDFTSVGFYDELINAGILPAKK